ncbi:MAG: succinate dehydrogenase, hydrophobic membrane anchor protein [Tatlockia sp.]|nr:succinate dehydrogenase, hydrophobic membrane anchor protein [Tatlockia sp.]
MVTNVTSLTGNGLKDWLIQRITAVYFAVYCLFILAYFFSHPHLNFEQWQLLFQQGWFKIFSLIALIALSLHTWIGIWTVTTDYMKSTATRLAVQMLVVLWLLVQFLWGLMIVWGQ